jgi:transcriptional regulator with XRE-family HTH domain
MGSKRIASNPLGGHALDYEQAGPTVLRTVVGARLRRLREAAGISREDAGAAIHGSHSKITRLELGRTGFKPRDMADLLTLYGVGAGTERATLLAMAEHANTPGWWSAYSDVLPNWFEPYLGLEQAARVIRTYEVQTVPGLLQTADYARAVIRLGHEGASRRDIDRRVRLRMRRQQILHQPGAPALWAVIDEAALRRPFGTMATMRAQLTHLTEIAELPNVTVQVIPYSAGGHPAIGGPVTILRFREGELADVVYLEQLESAVYPDKPGDAEHYWHIMNRLVIKALSPAATTAFLYRLLKQA